LASNDDQQERDAKRKSGEDQRGRRHFAQSRLSGNEGNAPENDSEESGDAWWQSYSQERRVSMVEWLVSSFDLESAEKGSG
jgi:hypothetical protein